ncbi:hypothetical protein [Arvimicrobium flavum]|uniref:hypothetical protein n=1 Tax=Arvimicrobium flavum TaxID=3393320 RepID=UPI00237B3FE2|nr:hypothetical protein [Mesorhizobium shangrilense]
MIGALDILATVIGAALLYGTFSRGKWDRANALAYSLCALGVTWLLIRLWAPQIPL